MAELVKYRNKGGNHTTQAGAVAGRGDVFMDVPGLDAKFENKFEVVQDGQEVAVTATPPAQAGGPEEGAQAEGPAEGAQAEGELVTEEWPTAVEADLEVRKLPGGKGWVVWDDGVVVTEKPLKKREVSDFIKEFLGV